MTKNNNTNDNEWQKRLKNEINHYVISLCALLCVSQSIIMCETWDPIETSPVPKRLVEELDVHENVS